MMDWNVDRSVNRLPFTAVTRIRCDKSFEEWLT